MRSPLLRAALCGLLLATPALAQDLKVDMTLHRLLIPGEGWQPVAENLGFADGPCTDAEGNLYYSDMKAPAIYRLALDGVQTKLSDEPASGLKWAPDGRLIACQGSKKRLIALTLPKGEIEVLAQDVQPNDLVVTAEGRVYFTETGKQQVTMVDLKTKAVSAADTGITGPNGIALTPDGGSLAVSDYKGSHVWLFRLEPDGRLSAKAPYMTLQLAIDYKAEGQRAEPPPYKPASGGDGMCTDPIGRFYVTSAVGLQVFDPTGRLCGVLTKPQADRPFTSCLLAGPRKEYLYVMNGDKIFRRKVQQEKP